MRRHIITGRTRRVCGWIISGALLLGYYSPQAEMLRTLPSTLVVAAGQRAELPSLFPLRTVVRTGEQADIQAASDMGERLEDSPTLAAKQDGQESLATISLMGLLPLREVKIDIRDDLKLYPGGQAVGVALHTDGVLVVGTSDLTGFSSPARLAGLKPGDLIMQVNERNLQSTDELTAMVAATQGKPLPLKVKRGDALFDMVLEPKLDGVTGTFRIGAWVRDSTAGVGTLSFYGEVEPGEGTRYGALGHAITDADTQQILTVSRGEMMVADMPRCKAWLKVALLAEGGD